MTSFRKTGLAVGVLFILTFVTSIGAVLAYGPAVSDPNYITGAGPTAPVFFGAFLDMLLILTNIGCAVVLYPILKRQSQALSLGYIAERIIEGAFILICALSLLVIATLRQQPTGTDATLTTIGASLLATRNWAFLLGPSFADAIGTGLILGWLMYRTGLVGRRKALLGVVGGLLLATAATAVMLGVIPNGSTVFVLMAVPEIIWELFLGLYLTFKGFNESSPLAIADRTRVAPTGALAQAGVA